MVEPRMRCNRFVWLGFASLLPVLVACQREPVQVALQFEAVADGKPLVLNEFLYGNPGGDGIFKVRDLQFFVSGIRLVAGEAVHEEAESYHLVRFDDGAFVITLLDVPDRDYDTVEFALGVDAAANGSLRVVGDLDPNGRMAWNWETGYKFILFEGALRVDDRQLPLVYHVGFDENLRRFSFPIDRLSRNAHLDLTVDVMRLFDGVATIDMTKTSNVKFDRADSKLIANNYARLIALKQPASP